MMEAAAPPPEGRAAMGAKEFYYHLPVNVGFVTMAIRDERPDTLSYLDLDTGGVFTLLLGEDAELLVEGLDCGLRHRLLEHPERFFAIDPLTGLDEFAGGLADDYLRRRLRKASEAEAAQQTRPRIPEEVLRAQSDGRDGADESGRVFGLGRHP